MILIRDKTIPPGNLKQGARTLRRVLLITLSVVCLVRFTHAKTIDIDPLDKTTLKMLYTYQFGKFTQWPKHKLNSSSEHFKYCILGHNPFTLDLLNRLTGKSVQGIPLSIAAFDSGLVPEEALSECHVLFISASEKHRLSTILSELKNSSILTISDMPEFSKRGGMVTLVEKNNKVHFQINTQALQQASLSVSSKIMELAEFIDDGKR